MSAVTLDAIQKRQAELAAMIQAFAAKAPAQTLQIAAASIDLAPGEHYAGTVLDDDGQLKHHLVLMADRPVGRLQWKEAIAWAEDVGGALPTRQEQALLFANCKAHIEPTWYWSSEIYEDNDTYAWCCTFSLGYQGSSLQSAEGAAVAVRLIPLETP